MKAEDFLWNSKNSYPSGAPSSLGVSVICCHNFQETLEEKHFLLDRDKLHVSEVRKNHKRLKGDRKLHIDLLKQKDNFICYSQELHTF